MHTDSETDEKYPLGQILHVDDPAVAKVPAKQLMQAALPVMTPATGENFPFGHTMQLLAELKEYVPSLQVSHETVPSIDENVPGRQLSQYADAACAANVPSSH